MRKVLLIIVVASAIALGFYLCRPTPAKTSRADEITATTTQASMASPPATRSTLKPRNDLPRLPNFAQVSPALYRGAQPTAEGFRQLGAMGVKTIVNLRSLHTDRDDLQGTGLRYAHFACKAWHPEEDDVIAFLKLMRDPANHPVFVHCQQDADRTGMMVAAYRIVEQGWTTEEAMAELPNFGFHEVWTKIKAYLDRFDAPGMKQNLETARTPQIDTVPWSPLSRFGEIGVKMWHSRPRL